MASDPQTALLEAVAQIVAGLPSPLELSGDFAICGDVHVPYTDWRYALRLAAVARKELKRPRRLIVAGDFWNYDCYSHYPPTTILPTWQAEKRAGKALAQCWATTFDEIVFLMGNHERRKQKWTQGEEDDEDIFSPLASVANIQSTAYGYAMVASGGVRWLVAHAREYSVNQLTVADQLAQKYQANVIDLHQHHNAMGYDRFGRYVIVDCGCLVDPGKLGYVQFDASKKGAMKRGFAVLRNGITSIFGEGLTDWSRYDR